MSRRPKVPKCVRHWRSYRACLKTTAPAAFDNLAEPASAEDLLELEQTIGVALPWGVRCLLLENNGQRNSNACCAMPGLIFLSSFDISKEWKMWASLREHESPSGLAALHAYTRSEHKGVRALYTHAGWIPLFRDGDRVDYLGVDVAPTEHGRVGQVINFGRDETTHCVAFPNLTKCIAFWLGELRAGRCRALRSSAPSGSVEWLEHRDGNSLDVLREHWPLRHASALPARGSC
jgi:cell wall assembly regulator SMI1